MYLLVKNDLKKKKEEKKKQTYKQETQILLALDTVMRCCIYKAICFLIVGLRLDFFLF